MCCLLLGYEEAFVMKVSVNEISYNSNKLHSVPDFQLCSGILLLKHIMCVTICFAVFLSYLILLI
jgi:hypothetical protein